MKTNSTFLAIAITGSLLSPSLFAQEQSLPEAGPENSGLRLRIQVTPRQTKAGDEFDVRLDLVNVKDEPVTVFADWPHKPEGDFSDYVEMAASIRTHPEIMLWGIQVMADLREKPESKHTLAAGETLSVKWTSKGRRLKNRLIRPNAVHNPYFPTDGLYATHVELKLQVPGAAPGTLPPRVQGHGKHAILLRSNEQLVSVGGSKATPKSAVARVSRIEEGHRSASISLGSLHGIEVGDEFILRTGMSVFWRLAVMAVEERHSVVTLHPQSYGGELTSEFRQHEYPRPNSSVGLVPPGTISWNWMWGHRAAAKEVVPIRQVAARLGTLIPDWTLHGVDGKPSIEVDGLRGSRIVLRRTWKEYLPDRFPPQQQQKAGIARGPFESRHEDWEFVLVSVDPTKAPAGLKSKIDWQKSSSPWHTRDVCLGEGHGYVWFTHGTIPFQDVVRHKLKLTGGDNPIQLAASGLLVKDDGHFTANSVPYTLARYGDEALPCIKSAIQETSTEDADTMWKVVSSLIAFRSRAATKMLVKLHGAKEETVSRPASYALIHEPFRRDAKAAYLKMLADRVYVDRVSRACVEFQWLEAIPLLDEIIARPKHFRELQTTLFAKRALQGKPVSQKLIEAGNILRGASGRNRTRQKQQQIERAQKLLVETGDSDAASLVALQLAVFVTKGNVREVRAAGMTILKERPRAATVKLLESVISRIDEDWKPTLSEILSSVKAAS